MAATAVGRDGGELPCSVVVSVIAESWMTEKMHAAHRGLPALERPPRVHQDRATAARTGECLALAQRHARPRRLMEPNIEHLPGRQAVRAEQVGDRVALSLHVCGDLAESSPERRSDSENERRQTYVAVSRLGSLVA